MKLSQYPVVTSLASGDFIPLLQSPIAAGSNKTITRSDFEASLTRFPILAPGSDTANLIAPSADWKGLTLQASASQTKSLLNFTGLRSAAAIDITRANNTDAGTYLIRGTFSDATEGTFSMLIDDSPVFQGVNDPCFFMGYNISENAGRKLLTEPAFMWSLEAKYATGSQVRFEQYLQYVSDTGTIHRPYMCVIDRVTDQTSFNFNIDAMNICQRDGSNAWLNIQNNAMILTNSSAVIILANNAKLKAYDTPRPLRARV